MRQLPALVAVEAPCGSAAVSAATPVGSLERGTVELALPGGVGSGTSLVQGRNAPPQQSPERRRGAGEGERHAEVRIGTLRRIAEEWALRRRPPPDAPARAGGAPGQSLLR